MRRRKMELFSNLWCLNDRDRSTSMSCLSILSLFLITLAICEICAQRCTQSSAVAPDKGRFIFYSDNRKAQLVCEPGFQPENNQYTMLHCNQGKWVGIVANCVPSKCQKRVLELPKYWPENGEFEFSPDSGSENMDHLTLATVVCDPDFYPARKNETDGNKYYTTFEIETFKCHFGVWVGKRKTKCIPKPGSTQDMYELYNTNNKDYTYIPWANYANVKATATIKKNGFRFAVLTKSTEECPEKVQLHRLHRPGVKDHMFTADEDYKTAVVGSNGWTYEYAAGACVWVKGQCGMTNELHGFYRAALTAHHYRRDLSYIANWAHNGIICYIF